MTGLKPFIYSLAPIGGVALNRAFCWGHILGSLGLGVIVIGIPAAIISGLEVIRGPATSGKGLAWAAVTIAILEAAVMIGWAFYDAMPAGGASP